MYFLLIFIFILGLVVGSFINALVYRLENKLTIKGRSICPYCRKEIKWFDLVPLLSWVLLGGKCRNCRKKISVQYPIVELITGVFFVFFVKTSIFYGGIYNELLTGNPSRGFLVDKVLLLLLLLIVTIFLIVALYDLKTTYVLSKYVYFGIAITLVYHLMNLRIANIQSLPKLIPILLSALIPALFFYGLSYFSKGRWMGEGDFEIAFFVGFFLGWPNVLVAFYTAFIIGALYGVTAILLKRLKMKSEIPFGPFLVGGLFVAFVFGEKLLYFYDKIFLGGV